MARFTAIDLENLEPPDIIETLSFEAILVELKADMQARMEEEELDFDVQDLESDPAVKLLEVAAAREVHLRARVNGAAKALLLALAQGTDLENLGAWFEVERQVITPATDTEAAVMESDTRFRRRIQLAPQAFSTAGPPGAYEFWALTAAPTVKSVGVVNPRPGSVVVYPLSMTGNGMPSTTELEAIRTQLLDEDVRPMTDVVTVTNPKIVELVVDLTLVVKGGPDIASLEATAKAAVEAYAVSRHKVGLPLYLSGIYQAAQINGVEHVIINNPTADVDPGANGAVYATAVTVGHKVLEE